MQKKGLPRDLRPGTARLPRRAERPAGHSAAAPGSVVAPAAGSGTAPGAETPPTRETYDGFHDRSRSAPGRASTQGPRTRPPKVHSLIDKVYDWNNLYRAWRRVRRNKGAHGLDRVTIRQFEADLETHLREIQRKLQQHRYLPQPVRRAYIPKASNPKKRRPLGIPIVADRIVGQALLQVLDPIFDGELSPRSFAYRKGRSTFDAITTLIRDAKQGYRCVVDADIESFFDKLDHQVVMSCVRRRIADGRVLDLIQAFLKAGIYERGVVRVPTEGTPQGGVISPWLANLVLDDLDKALEARGIRFARYADDFITLGQNRQEAEQDLVFIREVLAILKLNLNEGKTSLTSFREGFEFLGFHMRNYRLGIRDQSLQRFKDKVRVLTRRQQGRNVDAVLEDLNPVLVGWARYFGVAEVAGQLKTLDKWVRMRIRAFKLKRRCTNDNWRIPNKRLAKWGLRSLEASRPERRISYVDA